MSQLKNRILIIYYYLKSWYFFKKKLWNDLNIRREEREKNIGYTLKL
jgi:hypothetical protein